jgi:hypothetical protein
MEFIQIYSCILGYNKSRTEMGRQKKSNFWQIQNQAGQYMTILSESIHFCRFFQGCQMYNLFNINNLDYGTFIALLFASIFERRLK